LPDSWPALNPQTHKKKMKNYFNINPVALQIKKEGLILESAKTDAMLVNATAMFCDCLYNCLYCYAPKRDRSSGVLHKKFGEIIASKNLKSSLALAIEMAEDNDLSSPRYSEPRRLSVDAMQQYVNALLRATEVDNNNTKIILKEMKDSLQNIIQTAKEIEESEESLNENYGFVPKTENLRRKLSDLLIRSEGKDSSKGYGKNWKNIFTAYDQKVKGLASRSGASEKDYVLLDSLHKEIDKTLLSFHRSLVDSFDKIRNGVESDEAADKYLDVISGLKKATEAFNRAQSSEETVESEIEDIRGEKEESGLASIFPLKMGDTDERGRFKGKKIITLLHDALCVVPEFADVLKTEEKSKFGRGMRVCVQTIQKQSGNNNPNGEIDSALFAALKNSDWLEVDDRKAMDEIIMDIIHDKK
jgi:hypothetical protein